MSNLEFINKKIEETKQSIRHWEMQLKNYPDEEVLTRCLNTRKEELQAFQQVKTDLEAWEVVKPNIIEENKIIDREIKVIKVKCQLYPKGESNGKYEKLKKALERKSK